jgi:hypothetical protein
VSTGQTSIAAAMSWVQGRGPQWLRQYCDHHRTEYEDKPQKPSVLERRRGELLWVCANAGCPGIVNIPPPPHMRAWAQIIGGDRSVIRRAYTDARAREEQAAEVGILVPGRRLKSIESRATAPTVAAVAIRDACPWGDHAYLVGKGPSLDRLTLRDFPSAQSPVLCCNESVLAVERLRLPNPIFGIQQDARLERRGMPQSSPWLLSCYAWDACRANELPNAVQYTPEDYAGGNTSPTACVALRMLANAGGFRTVSMLAFDAVTDGNCDYAPSIGTSPDEWMRPDDADRFIAYGDRFRADAVHCGLALEYPAATVTVATWWHPGGPWGPEDVRRMFRSAIEHVGRAHRLCVVSTSAGQLGPVGHRVDLVPPGWAGACAVGAVGGADSTVCLHPWCALSGPVSVPAMEPRTLYHSTGPCGQPAVDVLAWTGDAMIEPCMDILTTCRERPAAIDYADPAALWDACRRHGVAVVPGPWRATTRFPDYGPPVVSVAG